MDRRIALKLAAAFGIFAVLFLGVWTLGGFLIGALLTGPDEASPAADFPEKNTGPRPSSDGSLLPRHEPSAAPAADSRAASLVRRLASSEYPERKAAEDGLVELGSAAVPDLERALSHGDPEVRWRAKEALRRIREDPGR
jgi:hypothetical protein